jgi:hypothetical protein
MEQEQQIEDAIIALAVSKGYLIIPTLETSVESVVRWLWSIHKVHIYTKIRKYPDGELFFYYCVQDFGHVWNIDRLSMNEENGDGHMYSSEALYAGVINILNKIQPTHTP